MTETMNEMRLAQAVGMLLSKLDAGTATESDKRLADDLAMWQSGWEAHIRRLARDEGAAPGVLDRLRRFARLG